MQCYFRQWSPTAADGGGDTGTNKVVRVPGLPGKDADVATVSKYVAKAWKTYPDLKLAWITQADFEALSAQYSSTLVERRTVGGGRRSKTYHLRTLDQQIDAALSSLKIGIQYKFTRRLAPAHYSRYGIIKSGNRYIFPLDRDSRIGALHMAGEAVAADGTGGDLYGPAFWAAMHTDYEAALKDTRHTDGKISSTAGEKNRLKATLRKAMRALQLLIQANYPDTYKAIYRAWGWQKEDY